MSYHDSYVWQQEERTGIEKVLGHVCELKYFNLDMKVNPKNGSQKAKEAFELYKQFRPDGVIVTDDAAQAAFVVPYLRDKVKTPVVFCGLNNDAEDYGFPASNVTGVLERFHTRETLSLLQQLVPNIKTIGFVMRGNEVSTIGIFEQIKEELPGYSLETVGFWTPVTYEEALETTRELKKKADALWVDHMEGLKDKNGRPYSNKELIKEMAEIWGNNPITCGQEHTVRYSCLCTVVESGVEQGMTASKMLLKARTGTPVSEIPVTRNYTGFKVINVTKMKNLGLNPRPVILQGAKLVTTEE
jgi:ABC-type uncharacterized transport system substrate-binding protein